MRRRSSKGRRKKDTSNSSNALRKETQTIVTRTVHKIQRSPDSSPEHYLQDERWDILPKTDYTYAKSGSYSPRFFGRKYVNPNMSRYRIRGRQSGNMQDEGGEELAYLEYSDDEVSFQQEGRGLDSDSDVSYETVVEDGIELRSGKSLQSMREVLHEHDKKLAQSSLINSSNRTLLNTSRVTSRSRRGVYDDNTNAQSTGKAKKSAQNQKQYTQSESKRYSTSHVDSLRSYDVDYNVRSRRSLNTDFSNAIVAGNRSKSRKDVISDMGRYSKSHYDEPDTSSTGSGYSLRTTKKIVTEEVVEYEDSGEEKGEMEISEKMSQSQVLENSQQNIDLYGLDSDDEFSDSGTVSSRSRSRLGNGSSRNGLRYSNSSTSTTTTIISIITETITSVSSPIVTPVWNTVGRPVWENVGRPVYNNVGKICISFIKSVLYLSWLLVTSPVVYVVKSVVTCLSWLWSSVVGGAVGVAAGKSPSLTSWLYREVRQISSQLVLMDTWFYKRRRGRGCCLCLPLLLLLPLLFAVWAGRESWSEKSSFLGFFSPAPCIPVVPSVIPEKVAETGSLNAEIKALLLQLQSRDQERLTAADVEAIVHRILGAESAGLKAEFEGSRNQDHLNQLQWKTDQELELGKMQKRHDELLAAIQGLEASISSQKASMDRQGEEMKSESTGVLAGLEEKLTGLHAELKALETDHAALLARVDDCCHNDTYYAAAIRDHIDTVLSQMMGGHVSGNPSQDAFTAWLQSNYVSREVLDSRLKDLSTDLTASVLAMMKEQIEAQQLARQADTQSDSQGVHVVGGLVGLDEKQVRTMIDEALYRYSADKTGIADYALESAGGTVVSTRCSETYYRKTALVSVFGIPLWYTSNSPRTVIQPEVYPGQCWAFRGSQGFIVIQTSVLVKPSGFTLEHIPKSLAPHGEIDSAPKTFTVLGLETEYDDQGTSLGNFTYNDEGKPMQFFPVKVEETLKPFRLYELKILSNYGNQQYTCLYRFRIHGKMYVP